MTTRKDRGAGAKTENLRHLSVLLIHGDIDNGSRLAFIAGFNYPLILQS